MHLDVDQFALCREQVANLDLSAASIVHDFLPSPELPDEVPALKQQLRALIPSALPV